MHQLLKGSDAFLLKVQSCFLQSNASGVGQYLQRGFLHQILDLFTVGQHVGGLDMGLQIFQEFPFLNDGDGIFTENLRRESGIYIHCRTVFDAAFFLEYVGDVGFEAFEKGFPFSRLDLDAG
jgi:hypothetical protein